VTGHDLAVLEIPTPPYERRLACWRAVEGLPADVDPAALASTFTLTPGQIDDAVAAARVAVATADPPRLTVDAIYRACRAQTGEGLVELARHVEPGYTWDDIVLPADKLAHLREIADHVRQHGRVYAEWGFADAFSLGNGIVVLFTGAPGTGKTMAADVIANDVGLDLYKIDLSRIVSKYIGETEKNLGRVFDEAAACNAILLFDEADALFGKRSDVRDAHDRYANVEVNYLLQRIEEHDGPVVLTTNFDQNIDDAFRRRIHHCVDFPLPDRDARERIWRSIFPDRTPVGDLDYAFVREFAFTGGHIKNVALTAAFMAAADGGVVEMPHVVRATARELQKTGTVVGPDMFGPYGEVVSP
jgi:SpoVK/Ycf46/Vps4 family AAA+-type ATPase